MKRCEIFKPFTAKHAHRLNMNVFYHYPLCSYNSCRFYRRNNINVFPFVWRITVHISTPYALTVIYAKGKSVFELCTIHERRTRIKWRIFQTQRIPFRVRHFHTMFRRAKRGMKAPTNHAVKVGYY